MQIREDKFEARMNLLVTRLEELHRAVVLKRVKVFDRFAQDKVLKRVVLSNMQTQYGDGPARGW